MYANNYKVNGQNRMTELELPTLVYKSRVDEIEIFKITRGE